MMRVDVWLILTLTLTLARAGKAAETPSPGVPLKVRPINRAPSCIQSQN